jgi:hypothetical protein
VLHTAARLERLEGETIRARHLEGQSLRLRYDIGEKIGIAECLEALGGLCAGTRGFARAARLFGSADDLRVRLGASRAPSAQKVCDEDRASIQENLGEDAFWVEWDAGRALNVDKAGRLNLHKAVEEALQEG